MKMCFKKILGKDTIFYPYIVAVTDNLCYI